MALIETTTVRLTGATRLPNSPSGNARWTLHTDQGDYRTKVNTSCAGEVTNYLPRAGKATRVTLFLTPAGFVYGIEKA